jgi:two-component system alkaline phosphatase synthesis response regulator PhoP
LFSDFFHCIVRFDGGINDHIIFQKRSVNRKVMAPKHILVVEDEEDIQELLRYKLTKEGFRVTVVSSGEEALILSMTQTFDLVLLDLILPGVDGMEICRHLKQNSRTQHMPIIIVTVKGDEADIVAGLEMGADDYVVKPFSLKVLLARIRSVLREWSRPGRRDLDPISIHGMEIHPETQKVVVQGNPVHLTPTEFGLLHLLASRPGWAFTRAQILQDMFGDDTAFTGRSVDVKIVHLRRKLGPASRFVETVRGKGYRLQEEAKEVDADDRD